ncbi:hypothetical protein ColLi_07319 [Colletotrichum liriopes]|uniref:Uncharacterized protein n=1 Tax=Colletotrichum liriopes TaxID=708192 RepID=A0AA37GNV3_9PEZI|nr:hypothetical protein ColLi_07319 [Colletotrichum liriopes]
MPALTLAISCFQPNDENEIHTNSYPVSPVGLFYSKSSADPQAGITDSLRIPALLRVSGTVG